MRLILFLTIQLLGVSQKINIKISFCLLSVSSVKGNYIHWCVAHRKYDTATSKLETLANLESINILCSCSQSLYYLVGNLIKNKETCKPAACSWKMHLSKQYREEKWTRQLSSALYQCDKHNFDPAKNRNRTNTPYYPHKTYNPK